jgi:indolepyruvate ferredoxin oxidoreductase beta subunit
VSAVRPITVTISALGGQGGGVVSDWLVDIGRRAGHLVQATSVPGVAQRTGATIYYLEFFPLSALPADGRRPVFALMPNPGDVDLLVASEIMEAGRAMQRGLVTERTTLIASSHRIYAIDEKSSMGDGRADATQVRTLARDHAKRFIEFDMQAVAEAHGSVISAVMLGALCGSGALPFAAEFFVEAIRAGGIAVDSSLSAFEAARRAAADPVPPIAAHVPAGVAATLPPMLEDRLAKSIPSPAQAVAREGVRRLIDYQDGAYADLYLDRLDAVVALERGPADGFALTAGVARGLALWMSFEDPIRVADLKIRSARARRVLKEVVPTPGQLVQVTEFMKPRVEEICGMLPTRLGTWILKSKARPWLARFTGGRRIATSTVSGFLQLYWLAGLRSWRRRTLRYAEEQARIVEWLELIADAAASDYALALEIAECQQLVKGYGETHERGTSNLGRILVKAQALQGSAGAADQIAKLRAAALADDQGTALSQALAQTATQRATQAPAAAG